MEEMLPLESTWTVAVATGAIALIMLLQLARSLPGQNVVMIAASLLAGEGALELLMIQINGMKVTGPMWCFMAGAALLWLAVVLSARRLSKLILRPWRAGRFYGYWLIGMSALGTALVQFGWPALSVEAVDAKPIGAGVALGMAGIRGVATIILLICLTPWLIRKRPDVGTDDSEFTQKPKNYTQQNTGQ
jgi:hypothetical protein